MEKNDKLHAENQLLNTLAFLFVSGCAGLSYLIGLPLFAKNILLQCTSIVIGTFGSTLAFFGVSTFIKINDFKK